MTRKVKPVILAMLFVSVNALAMTSSRNKADRAGSDKGSTSSQTGSQTSSQTGSTTTSPTANTSGGSASDTSYDSSSGSASPTASQGSGPGSASDIGSTGSTINKGATSGMDKESLRAQADKDCESSDTTCLESKKAAEESLKRY